jgi:hypothetical protein
MISLPPLRDQGSLPTNSAPQLFLTGLVERPLRLVYAKPSTARLRRPLSFAFGCCDATRYRFRGS